MQHLSKFTNPIERGLMKFYVHVHLRESGPLPSMLDEGISYTLPDTIKAIYVYAEGWDDIVDVLKYHWQDRLVGFEVKQQTFK